jgi:hypothetical protein
MALVVAHIDLARTEASAIAGEVGRLAALVALAIALVVLAVLLAVIGTSMFLGEWLLGSIGWGVLHGILAFVAIALAAVLIGLGVSIRRIGRALIVSIVVGVVLGILLGLDLPNQLYASIGRSLGLAVDPAIQPLVVGLILGALVGLIAGIIVASRMPGAGGGRFVAIAGLVVAGVLVGAFSAITFGPQVGAALGITAGWVAWIALMGVDVARTGIDIDALTARFYPSQTIETSKETLEWLQKRMPPGFGS